MDRPRFVTLSGCSGGGKSTLLAALAARGMHTVTEPGRRVVAAELASGGTALPWRDMAGFIDRIVALSQADLIQARCLSGPVLFDRGPLDALLAQERFSGKRVSVSDMAALGFSPLVFFAPAWPGIFSTDPERRHGFDAAVAEADFLLTRYRALGFEVIILPKKPVADRVSLVEAHLGLR